MVKCCPVLAVNENKEASEYSGALFFKCEGEISYIQLIFLEGVTIFIFTSAAAMAWVI